MPTRAGVQKTPKKTRRSLADVEEQVNICYYGEPGSAKTTSIAAGSRLGKMLLINAEAGVKARPLRDLGMDLDNIEIFPDSGAGERLSFDDLEELFWDLRGRFQDEDPDAPVVLGWDSVTETQKLLMADVLAEARERAEARGKDRGRFDTYQEDWGTNTEQMRELIRYFRDLPCHFAMAALPRRDVDDDGSVLYGPAVTPALQNDIFAYVDILCHTEEMHVEGAEDPLYIGRFRKTGKFRAKDRFRALPRVLVNPWMDRVVAYVNGDLTVEDDPIQQEGLALLKGRTSGTSSDDPTQEVVKRRRRRSADDTDEQGAKDPEEEQ